MHAGEHLVAHLSILIIIDAILTASNAFRKVHSSYRMQPSAHISVLASYL